MKKYIISVFLFLSLFSVKLSFARAPDYVNYVVSHSNSTYYEVNEYWEYTWENWDKYKLATFICYPITSTNYNLYTQKWYVINALWNYCFTKTINSERKIPYSEIWKYYKLFNYSLPLSLENDYYYTYKYSKYYYFDDNEWFYLSDFTKSWYTKDNIIVLKNASKYLIVKDFKKIKLFNKSLLTWIRNKLKFVQTVYDDIKKSDTDEKDIEKTLLAMKSYSSTLKWKDYDTKIKNIYKYVIDRTSYYTWSLEWNLDWKPIFSWIYTYKTWVWVCDWYVKEMLYLLFFAGIEDVSIKRWFVIDSDLFPDIWHAWIKVWDYYYDPTFEDPIWQNRIKSSSDYEYYKLPRDLIYADRFNAETKEDIPNEYIFMTKTQRENLVSENLYNLAKNSTYSNYLLLSTYVNKIKLWLWLNDKLTMEQAKKIIPYVEASYNYTFTDSNWIKRHITNLKFYTVSDLTIDSFMKSIFWYQTSWLMLIKWRYSDWTYEYRLTKNINYY